MSRTWTTSARTESTARWSLTLHSVSRQVSKPSRSRASISTSVPGRALASRPATRSTSSGCTRASSGCPTTSWSDRPSCRAAAGDCQRTISASSSIIVTSVDPMTSERNRSSRSASFRAYWRTSVTASASRTATTITPAMASVDATASNLSHGHQVVRGGDERAGHREGEERVPREAAVQGAFAGLGRLGGGRRAQRPVGQDRPGQQRHADGHRPGGGQPVVQGEDQPGQPAGGDQDAGPVRRGRAVYRQRPQRPDHAGPERHAGHQHRGERGPLEPGRLEDQQPGDHEHPDADPDPVERAAQPPDVGGALSGQVKQPDQEHAGDEEQADQRQFGRQRYVAQPHLRGERPGQPGQQR